MPTRDVWLFIGVAFAASTVISIASAVDVRFLLWCYGILELSPLWFLIPLWALVAAILSQRERGLLLLVAFTLFVWIDTGTVWLRSTRPHALQFVFAVSLLIQTGHGIYLRDHLD